MKTTLSKHVVRIIEIISSYPFLLYLIQGFLILSFFQPSLGDINPWDEAAYLQSGWSVIESGQIPIFSNNPFVSFFYASLYLPFRNSVFWMVYIDSIGRFLAFSLVWIGFYRLGRQLSKYINPLVIPGLLLVTPIFSHQLRFPSDPLYTGFAAIALSYLVAAIEKSSPSDLVKSSLFLGLAALSRNDGLFLIIPLLLVAIVLAIRNQKILATLLAVLGPFTLIVAGYVVGYGLYTGNYSLGLGGRTYDNFETGQMIILTDSGDLGSTIQARIESERIFGSAEENNFSVLTAIQKNPEVYLERLFATIRKLPGDVFSVYGKRLTLPFFLFALIGVVELLRQKKYLLLFAMVGWILPFFSGFVITLIRSGHLLFYSYILFAFVAIGLRSILNQISTGKTPYFLLLTLAAFSFYGILDAKLAIPYGCLLLLLCFLLILKLYAGKLPNAPALALLILLIATLILQGNFPSFSLRKIGSDPVEQVVEFIHTELTDTETIAAIAPGVIYAAGKSCAVLGSRDVPTDRSPEEFLTWFRNQGITTIYVDRLMTSSNPVIWNMIQPLLGTEYERIFQVEEGDFQILRIIEAGS